MATYDNPFNNTSYFDEGPSVVSRGAPNIDDTENYKIYQKRLEIESAMQLQEERDQMVQELQRQTPDGRGFRAVHDKYLQDRIGELVNRVGDQETATQLAHTLGNYYTQASEEAQRTENQLTRRAAIHTLNQSQTTLTDQVRKDPDSVDAFRAQAVSTTYEIGKALGWNDDDIQKEVKKFDKDLVSSALLEKVVRNPDIGGDEAMSGKYANILSEKEREAIVNKAEQLADFKDQVRNLPPVEQLIYKNQSIINSGQDPQSLHEQGQITDTDLEVAKRLQAAELKRESDKNYAMAKQMLVTSTPEGLTNDEQSERLARLQELYDTKQLNPQAVQQINQETKQKLIVKADTLLKKSDYVKKSITDLKPEEAVGALNKIIADQKSGKISRKDALEQMKIINKARKLI